MCRRLAREHVTCGLAHRHAAGPLVVCDLRDGAAFRAVLRAHTPDAVVHCAAYREPDFCEDQPEEAARLNVAPVATLAVALPPEARLILISTDYVFDGTRPPYRETDDRHPLSVYGRTKAAAEDLALARPGSLVVRIPVLVGAGPTLETSGYIGQLVAAVRGRTPQQQDHVLVRVPTWIEDVADAVSFLLARRTEGIVHVSGPRAATRYASALEVAQILGLPHDHLVPSLALVARRAPRPLNSMLGTDRLRGLGYHRATDFADVVRAVLAAVEGGHAP